MDQPLVYLGGRLVPQGQALLPIHDAGLVAGATVTDFCRTFRRKLFRWPDHLARFRRDCGDCFIPLPPSDEELTAVAGELVEHNARLLPPGGELALVSFATPGPLGTYAGRPGDDGPATLVLHTFPLPFARYRRFFTEGVALAVAGHHGADPADLAPPAVKHRSRLHWWRADHLVRRRRDVPEGALALLLDRPGGCLTETAIGNVLAVSGGAIRTPPRGSVLDGVSLRVVEELCGRLGLAFQETPLTLSEIQSAEEVMLCGTAFCLAGVRWLEGALLPWPGPAARQLLQSWSDEVGVDVAGQFISAG
jgi:branched-chain amino acid aminotransferase